MEPTIRSKRGSFLERGGLWVLGQAALMAGVVVLGLAFDGRRSWPHTWTLAGGAIMGAGGILALAGFASLRGGLTPFPKPRERARLVQDGVYSVMRHPLYTSVIS